MRWFAKAIPSAQHAIVITTVLAIVALGYFAGLAIQDLRDLADRQAQLIERQEQVINRREERSTESAERIERAVQRILEEVRDPQSAAGDTREETFDRIRQLCEIHESCQP